MQSKRTAGTVEREKRGKRVRRKGKGAANRIAKQLAAVGALPNSFQLAVQRSLHRTHRDTMRRVWGRYRYPGTGSTAQQTAEKTVKQVVCVCVCVCVGPFSVLFFIIYAKDVPTLNQL